MNNIFSYVALCENSRKMTNVVNLSDGCWVSRAPCIRPHSTLRWQVRFGSQKWISNLQVYRSCWNIFPIRLWMLPCWQWRVHKMNMSEANYTRHIYQPQDYNMALEEFSSFSATPKTPLTAPKLATTDGEYSSRKILHFQNYQTKFKERRPAASRMIPNFLHPWDDEDGRTDIARVLRTTHWPRRTSSHPREITKLIWPSMKEGGKEMCHWRHTA